MSKTPVWFDADMGSDDVLCILAAIGSDQFAPLGLSTVFGNISGIKALSNATELMTAFRQTHIPIYGGAEKPFVGGCLFGDNAYGDDGFGGVRLTDPATALIRPQDKPAHLALIDGVLGQSDKVTILATGPVTNLANALAVLQHDPAKLKDFKDRTKLIIMGGAFQPGPHPNPPERIGNITLHSEFNAHMDPYALNKVLEANFDAHIVTMDATQHTSLTRARQEAIRQEIAEPLASKLISMARIVEELDTSKFTSEGPFIHDPQVVVYALDPEAFKAGQQGITVEINPPAGFDPTSTHGRFNKVEDESPEAPVLVTGIKKSPDEIFDGILTAVRNIAPEYRP